MASHRLSRRPSPTADLPERFRRTHQRVGPDPPWYRYSPILWDGTGAADTGYTVGCMRAIAAGQLGGSAAGRRGLRLRACYRPGTAPVHPLRHSPRGTARARRERRRHGLELDSRLPQDHAGLEPCVPLRRSFARYHQMGAPRWHTDACSAAVRTSGSPTPPRRCVWADARMPSVGHAFSNGCGGDGPWSRCGAGDGHRSSGRWMSAAI